MYCIKIVRHSMVVRLRCALYVRLEHGYVCTDCPVLYCTVYYCTLHQCARCTVVVDTCSGGSMYVWHSSALDH